MKLKPIAQSGGHAKLMIEEDLVRFNGEPKFRKRKELRAGDIIELDGIRIEIHDELS